MVTIRDKEKIVNNNDRKIAASASGRPVVTDWGIAVEVLVPGTPAKFGAGVGGQTGLSNVTAADTGFRSVDAIIEYDDNQVGDCTTGYEIGDYVPYLPLISNKGLLCRNLISPSLSGQIVPPKSLFTAELSGFKYESAPNWSSGNEYYVQNEYQIPASTSTRLVARLI